MLTKSTARYFAKQAYQLRLMTGREQQRAESKEGPLQIRHHPGAMAVIHGVTGECIEFRPIPKSWAKL